MSLCGTTSGSTFRGSKRSLEKGSPLAGNEVALPPMQELEDAGILLPASLPFKRIQLSEKYPKGQARGRHWKHLKQMLQAETYHLYPADEPNYMNIEAPPSMYPAKKYCDITGFEAPYKDPKTKLQYANTDIFKQIRALPNESVQQYLSLRNAQVVLK
ncbi:hypothetical protein KP509_16G075300 [Ceratopteris richardii]|uniref:Vps72/YL1 C-terminal domain-containing protein n=1 Tax=Ceratopteris richardii TaxID=49495 RepID=A0A8T2T1Z1_CERRI|nr:hypothetical protein KP509_16G075300 [Ceratopteris richardii]KAH7388438.1 hypothetical protein KP509_16G075300 [Ceratopteris richardii]